MNKCVSPQNLSIVVVPPHAATLSGTLESEKVRHYYINLCELLYFTT